MKKTIYILFIIILMAIALVVTGCTTSIDQEPVDQPGEVGEEIEEEAAVEESTNEWPLEKEDIMMIEGMEEAIKLKLFQHDGLPFLTYYTEDMIADTVSSGEGDTVWFYAGFNGNKYENVFIQFTFFPQDREMLDIATLAELNQWNIDENSMEKKQLSWSIEEAYIKTQEITGFIAIGEYEGQYFMMAYQYPWEFGDGFHPRINKIIENFYFIDQDMYLNEL